MLLHDLKVHLIKSSKHPAIRLQISAIIYFHSKNNNITGINKTFNTIINYNTYLVKVVNSCFTDVKNMNLFITKSIGLQKTRDHCYTILPSKIVLTCCHNTSTNKTNGFILNHIQNSNLNKKNMNKRKNIKNKQYKSD